MLRFIKNKFDDIYRIYHQTPPNPWSHLKKDVYHDFFGMDFCSTPGIDLGAWCNKIDENGCLAWHVDNRGQSNMIISSYPNTTEILIPITYTGTGFNEQMVSSSCKKQDEMEEIPRLIWEGHFKIFRPNPGDIYFLDKKVIHRTNPLATGDKHLCMRIWNVDETKLDLIQ
jgi:hypothetical protein